MISRRSFLTLSAAAGLSLYWKGGTLLARAPGARGPVTLAAIPGGTLDPASIPKYVTPLVIPPVMPRSAPIETQSGPIDYYEIAVRQFEQQILPAGLPATTVWSYGSANHPATFHYPAFTIEAAVNTPVRVKWINDLKRPDGSHLPHLLPVDQTLHWANPPGGTLHRDHIGSDPTPYTGPVPIVTHVHGAHTTDESDGYAEAWFLPAASDIPDGYAREGTWYATFAAQFAAERSAGHASDTWEPGSTTFQYPNAQRAATLWYHDHTLGMTRLNVYAGPAGFYLLRGGPDDVVQRPGGQPAALPGPAPTQDDAEGTRYYEIPIAIQDRSFNADGSLFYPDNRAFFEGLTPDRLQIPFIPDTACDGQPSDIAPIWNPEFFGNTMVVNGRSWPLLMVEPRRYRLRLLNGCNSRFLILRFDNALPFWQIGADGGFLPEPVRLDTLVMAPAERVDVMVDFSELATGTEFLLRNEGPDEPFKGFNPDGTLADGEGGSLPPADPLTTGQVMKFVVGELAGEDTSTPPGQLILPARVALGAPSVTRRLSLNEEDSATIRVEEEDEGEADRRIILACAEEEAEAFGPRAALLGTVDLATTPGVPKPVALLWMDAISENPAVDATEVWEFYNYTMDAHPIHIHEVMFEIVDRQPFDRQTGALGALRAPEPGETGVKDTVIAYPGEITRIKARFDLPGLFVWHCHIVEHEDNEMMRPYAVGPIPALDGLLHKVYLPFVAKE